MFTSFKRVVGDADPYKLYAPCADTYTPYGVMIYSPDGLMRYNDSFAIADDIPLLSQWIKNPLDF